MDKLKMHSLNKVDANIAAIGRLFPNCVTERMGENGAVEAAIDFDLLKQELSCVIVEGQEERYQFTWPDKKKAVLAANAPISATLRPCREESVDFDSTQNLYIEGDNLDVLKLLQETYLGKIKMIYIDPPYNTGNDFVYSDDFAENTGEYLANSGQYDEKGNRLVTNTESNGRFHTDWLNMMYPRLKLARDLLTDDGVIFISIDENELDNLVKIGNEVFGEENAIPLFNRVTKKSSNSGNNFSPCMDYVVPYAKNIHEICEFSVPLTEEIRSRYKFSDEYVNERGRYQEVGLFQAALKHGGSTYPIECPDGEKVIPPNGQPWRWNRETYEKGLSEGRIVFKQSDRTGLLDAETMKAAHWNVYTKVYLAEREGKGIHPKNFSDEYQNTLASNELNRLGIPFDFAKPTKLLTFLAGLLDDPEGIYLDFFSGSGTTAHALMQLNAEDGGHRKFIMVQLPEETDAKSEACRAGYHNICEIGKERIRRAGKKLKEVCPTLDTGFRVLKLDSSNMKDVYYSPADVTRDLFDQLAENIKEDRTPEDLLFQVMLDRGISLSGRIEETVITGKKVFNVEDNLLIACFDRNLTEDVITAIARKRPDYFVMRDSSMADDSVATNFDHIFAAISPDTDRKVL